MLVKISLKLEKKCVEMILRLRCVDHDNLLSSLYSCALNLPCLNSQGHWSLLEALVMQLSQCFHYFNSLHAGYFFINLLSSADFFQT